MKSREFELESSNLSLAFLSTKYGGQGRAINLTRSPENRDEVLNFEQQRRSWTL